MILTFNEQQTIKPVSINNQTRFEQIAKETEELELDKLLGTAFYQDIATNYIGLSGSEQLYIDLVDGCTFTDVSGNTLTHKGLKYVLAYLNYAAYIQESSINDTFTGIVQKTRPDSEQVSQGTIKNIVARNREIAFNYFEKTRIYLFENNTLYPLWYSSNEKRVKTFGFVGVRRTIK